MTESRISKNTTKRPIPSEVTDEAEEVQEPEVESEDEFPEDEVESETGPEEQAGAIPAEPVEDFDAGVLANLDSLYRTALRMTNNREEAEDLVQETLLKAFRFSNRYKRGTNLRAWLFRILNTTAINRYRRLAAHPTPAALPEGEDFYLYNRIRDLAGQEMNEGADEAVLSRYLDEDVYKALSDLPPNFRMAIILADIEGLSYKEIAEALQIPIGTVMSRISRARRLLQQSLWQYALEKGYVRPQPAS
jgi:RNA polymerase sigma-70 factor, ECF subfamily